MVLIGCDKEAILAIEAALRLGPDQVAGLILCGDLTYAKEHVAKLMRSIPRSSRTLDNDNDSEDGGRKDYRSIDSFLRDYLNCPCTIVWDGDASYYTTNGLTTPTDGRVAVLGGGIAPHRQFPDRFAWVVSRFIEKHVINSSVRGLVRGGSAVVTVPMSEEVRLGINMVKGSLLLAGRGIASAIVCVSVARVFPSWGREVGNVYGRQGGLRVGWLRRLCRLF